MRIISKSATVAGIAGLVAAGMLSLSQPASATSGYLECEGGGLKILCDVAALTGTVTNTVWTYNGYVRSEWNGRHIINPSCGTANRPWTVSVTYLDPDGVSQTDQESGACYQVYQ